MASRLSPAALADLGRTPALDRTHLETGIIHLGIGVFARAHTAVFTEDAMLATGDTRWGMVGVTQRSDTVVEQLAPQGGLFTVSERGTGAAPLRVVSSVREAISGLARPDLVVACIAAPTTAVVTLTVTEKGYRVGPTTAIGHLVRGLQARMENDGGPVTVVSCDNLPHNGVLTHQLVRESVAALPAAEAAPLRDWVAEHVSFPSTMVDRMAPATTEGDIAAVERELGLRDEGAVVAEPFRQWVIEDAFSGPRPPWEHAGAVFTDDVAPWEAAKLRLLNASHSLIAYLGLLAGLPTISDAVADDAFHLAAYRMMTEDALPVISLPDGLDGQRYCEQVLSRFANPALGHTTAKVGSDGSQKIGPRLLSTVRDALAAGHEARWASLAIAAWMRRVATAPPGELNDPLAGELQATLPSARTPTAVVRALAGSPLVIDEELAGNEIFLDLLEHWYRVIDRGGADGLRSEIKSEGRVVI
jgi:fructuronate reductase